MLQPMLRLAIDGAIQI